MEVLLAVAVVWMLAGVALWNHSQPRIGLPEEVEVGGEEEFTLPGRVFARKIVVWGFLVRLVLVLIINATDAIRTLHLSPDSLRYHRLGMEIADNMRMGDFDWPNWIDNGWFQFTGFVYYTFGPFPILIQILNISFGAIIPLVVYSLVKDVYANEKTARWAALFTAFLPSFIYWSCLMLKDSASIFAVCLIVLSIVKLKRKFHPKWLLSMAFSLVIILGVREYLFFVALLLIPLSFMPVGGRVFALSLPRLLFITLILGAAARAAGFGFLGLDYISSSDYFDLEYINHTRVAMGDHGTGAFFKNPAQAQWGGDMTTNMIAAVAAVFFFFISLDLRNLDSARQWMALPEVLLILTLIPSMVRGMVYSWRKHKNEALPLFVFALSIMVVYGAATTNMGAMFRWRMQSMPLFLSFISCGMVVAGKGWHYRQLSKMTRRWL